MFNGKLQVQLDDKEYALKGAWVITIPPGVVHGFCFLPKTQGIVLTIAQSILKDEAQSKYQYYVEAFTQVARVIEFEKNNVLLKQLLQYVALIENEFKTPDANQSLMLDSLVRLLLMTIKRQYEASHIQENVNTKNSKMLNDFKGLLEENYSQHLSVQGYAKALYTSPSTLNRLCKEVLGLPVKSLIQERLYLEIRRKLIYTQATLEQISYQTGFKDPGYFSRFFKKIAGISPKAYRQKHYD